MLVETELRPSPVHGIGLFAAAPIPAGTEVWRFEPGFDLAFSRGEEEMLPAPARAHLAVYAWRSVTTGRLCHASDNAKHFNHSDDPNCSSVHPDPAGETVCFALRDIAAGEELTGDYGRFDADWTGERWPSVQAG